MFYELYFTNGGLTTIFAVNLKWQNTAAGSTVTYEVGMDTEVRSFSTIDCVQDGYGLPVTQS